MIKKIYYFFLTNVQGVIDFGKNNYKNQPLSTNIQTFFRETMTVSLILVTCFSSVRLLVLVIDLLW